VVWGLGSGVRGFGFGFGGCVFWVCRGVRTASDTGFVYRVSNWGFGVYRVTSLIRNCVPLGPCSRPMPMALRWSYGGGNFLWTRYPCRGRGFGFRVAHRIRDRRRPGADGEVHLAEHSVRVACRQRAPRGRERHAAAPVFRVSVNFGVWLISGFGQFRVSVNFRDPGFGFRDPGFGFRVPGSRS